MPAKTRGNVSCEVCDAFRSEIAGEKTVIGLETASQPRVLPREALQPSEQWQANLRSEPKVARLLLRRLVGPLTLGEPCRQQKWIEWEASVTPALLEGLVTAIHHLTSPRGTSNMYSPLRGRFARVA